MWRIINGALLAKERLQHHKMLIDPHYDGCNSIETIAHALFGCAYVKAVYKKARLWESVKECRLEVATEVVLGVF